MKPRSVPEKTGEGLQSEKSFKSYMLEGMCALIYLGLGYECAILRLLPNSQVTLGAVLKNPVDFIKQ